MVDPGPIVMGGGGGGGGGGAGGSVVGAAVGGGAGASVEVVVASVVDVLVVVVDVVDVLVVASLRPASTTDVAGAAPSLESQAAAMNSIVSAKAQIRLRIVKLLCHPCVVVGRNETVP
jgi:hypothetical protein